MSTQTDWNLLMFLSAAAALAGLALLICYLWGRLVGRTARRMQVSQWRAYAAALFPFVALFATMTASAELQTSSTQFFLGLSSPALIGTFQRWHWGPAVHRAQLF